MAETNTLSGLSGVEFFDTTSNRQMKYVYRDSNHWAAGWILYRHDGQWVTLRKATKQDIDAINRAMKEAHHA